MRNQNNSKAFKFRGFTLLSQPVKKEKEKKTQKCALLKITLNQCFPYILERKKDIVNMFAYSKSIRSDHNWRNFSSITKGLKKCKPILKKDCINRL